MSVCGSAETSYSGNACIPAGARNMLATPVVREKNTETGSATAQSIDCNKYATLLSPGAANSIAAPADRVDGVTPPPDGGEDMVTVLGQKMWVMGAGYKVC